MHPCPRPPDLTVKYRVWRRTSVRRATALNEGFWTEVEDAQKELSDLEKEKDQALDKGGVLNIWPSGGL